MEWQPYGNGRTWVVADLRVAKTGMGDDTSYCAYAANKYLGSERTLEAAQALAESRTRKESKHVVETPPVVASDNADPGPAKPVGPAVYPVNGRVRGSLVDAFYPKKENK